MFLLGRVRSPAQLDALKEMAAWLDANKFPCEFSVRENFMFLDITAKPDFVEAGWTHEEFRLYAAEIVIHALAKCAAKGKNNGSL